MMRRYLFIKGRLHGTQAQFLQSVAYNQGEAEPRRSHVPGDGLNRVEYIYMPENEIQLPVDPVESAAFITAAKMVLREESAPLELIAESGESLHAIVWELEESNTVVIRVQPDDGRW